MSLFNGKRLPDEVFKLDVERMRRGWYSDKYFENVGQMLSALAQQGYRLQGTDSLLLDGAPDPAGLDVGNVVVEMQWFTRRKPCALVVGVDKALSMLRQCTGHFDPEGHFVATYELLEVEAVQDGAVVRYGGDPTDVRPVMRVRGRYRDFALLETPTLGALSRGSRIATNVYHTLVAARGKPVLFFPARFDAHEIQAMDGYAYEIAVERFNLDSGQHVTPYVSTDAQGDWWGGAGGGTVPHAIIACFTGDLPEAMLAFAATVPPDVPRIALVDFRNDSVGDSLATAEAMFHRHMELSEAGREEQARRYVLFGVRLDTSANLRDAGVPPLGDRTLDCGVVPRLVWIVRQALNQAWEGWDIPERWRGAARDYCRRVRIVVSGGFGPDKIHSFEQLQVPVDIYGVGSSLLSNCSHCGTNTDFTADVVRIELRGEWVDMAKVGRAPCDNPDLERIQ
jgi:nicotinate phosphoribosyltransferase